MDTQNSDPVDWGVDQVVKFLCNPQEAPWADSATSSRPNLTALGAALRDNEINGEALLHDVDREALRDDLGIKALGHRSSVLRAIDWLRVRSPKYQTSKLNLPSTNKHSTEHNLSSVNSPVTNASVEPPSHIPSLPPDIPPAPVASDTTGNRQMVKQNFPSFNQPQSAGKISSSVNSPSTTFMEPPSANPSVPPEMTLAPAAAVMKVKRRIAPTQVIDSNGQRVGDGIVPTGQASLHNQATDLSPQPIVESMENSSTEAVGDDGGSPKVSLSGANLVGSSTMALELQLSADKSLRLKKADDFFEQLLAKHPSGGQEDEILPLYGESDAEYDAETLKEIDEDELDSMAGLSWSECEVIVSEFIAAHEKAWKEHHLPKHRQYAQVVWQQARDAHTGKAYKSDVSKNLARFRLRLKSQRDALIKVKYRSKAAFHAACRVMDTTLDQICFEEWRLETIELEKCPPFVPPPPRVFRSRKRRMIEVDEESLGSDSEIASDDEASGNEASADESESESESGGDIPARPQRDLPWPAPRTKPLVTLRSDSSEEDFVANKRRRLMGSQDHNDAERLISPSKLGPFAEIEDEESYPLSGMDQFSPSGALLLDSSPQVLRRSDMADEMLVETPPLNPTLPASSPQDFEMDDDLLVKTPPLNPTNLPQPNTTLRLSLPSPEQPSGNNGDLVLRPQPFKTPSRSVSLEKDSSDITSPNMDDIDVFDMVVLMNSRDVEAEKNRIWLLAKYLTGLPSEENKYFGPYMEELMDPVYMEEVTLALQAMLKNQYHLAGRTEEQSQPAMRLGAYFVSWHSCKMLTARGMGKEPIQEALEALEDDDDMSMFLAFFHRLKKLYTSYRAWLSRQPFRKSGHSTYSESAGSDSNPHRRKKKSRSKPFGPRPLSTMQRDAQARQAKQDKDRERLRMARESKGLSNSDPEGQAVTFKEPVIYLHPHLGRYVKPHQLTGIQFMWRELIEADNQQGCLLAHVMGLGKSMQVISLLVTIAAAATSDNPEIRDQIPQRFHRSQTLVLCPSSVVQNWVDEFAIWTPIDHDLGSIREITPRGRNLEMAERLKTIRDWNRKGGVLIMSYEMLRILIANKPARLNEEEHDLVKRCLLEGPNIIVADEAHKLRSGKSAISQVASRFKSTSRIAMTGSPLSNQLFEYYQMVEWVAPGYLEDPATFKKKFMDPIQAGSYIDSTRAEQRESLITLQLLNGILAPKVLRADTSVLAADLPPKTEFVLTVPLTEMQRKAYDTFVDCAKSGDSDANPRLWSWLAVMQLCCNHPFPFREKLADRFKKQEDNEGQSILSGSIQDAGLPSDLVSKMEELFSKHGDLQDIDLSNRAILLDKILDLSIQARDKVLIFTQSIPTMNYLDLMLSRRGRRYQRIDGSTPGADRQIVTKRFNSDNGEHILLISTRAGGVGLNMFGANRVVIFDFLFNPMWEEQAVGRAYRLGQKKPVYVYRFLAGGTFEELIYNNAVFKRQLAVRVVDKKTVVRESLRKSSTYLHYVKNVKKDEHYPALGRDPDVLDQILRGEYSEIVLKATLSHIQNDENDHLTEEESRQVDRWLADERMKRVDPAAYHAEMKRREDAEKARQQEAARLVVNRQFEPAQVQQRSLQMNQAGQQQEDAEQADHEATRQRFEKSVQECKLSMMTEAGKQDFMMESLTSLSQGPIPMSKVGKSPLSVNNRGATQSAPLLSGAKSRGFDVRTLYPPDWPTFVDDKGVTQYASCESVAKARWEAQGLKIRDWMQPKVYQPSSSSFQPAGLPAQPVSPSVYVPSSSSLRQAGCGESQPAIVVPADNDVIVIEDDSAHSSPVKVPVDPSHPLAALSPTDNPPLSPTPLMRGDVTQENHNQPTSADLHRPEPTTAKQDDKLQGSAEHTPSPTRALGGDGSVDLTKKNAVESGCDQVTDPAVTDQEKSSNVDSNGIVDPEANPSQEADNGTALEKPATNPIGTSQAESMDLRNDSASKPVALGASLDVAVAIPIASSQSEAMDISDGP